MVNVLFLEHYERDARIIISIVSERVILVTFLKKYCSVKHLIKKCCLLMETVILGTFSKTIPSTYLLYLKHKSIILKYHIKSAAFGM